jgi:glycosyltransferase involved in cell wall biosynthesis
VVRLRLGATPPPRPAPVATDPAAPVVLFLPAHDEEASVGAVVRRAPTSVCGRPVRVVVVDDGSRDATAARAREAGATVVPMPANQGLGAAVRRGLRFAVDDLHASAVAFCDADGEYAPEELERLVRPVLDGDADYVIGSRFAGDIERMLPHRRAGNLVLTRGVAFCARRRITDGQSGYRAFSAGAAAAAEVVHDYNYAQVLTLDLLAKGYRYLEVPISYSFRRDGRSFVRLGRYLRRVIPAVYRELNAP